MQAKQPSTGATVNAGHQFGESGGEPASSVLFVAEELCLFELGTKKTSDNEMKLICINEEKKKRRACVKCVFGMQCSD